MQTVSFTYKFKKEKAGYSVVCLDWENAVYTCGDDYNEMLKNARELTEGYLEMRRDGELSQWQQPNIKPRGYSKHYFRLTFDTITCKCISESENIKKIAG